MSKRIMKYNPAFLSDEELIDSFVVRQAELELIVETIRENRGEVNQHILILGPRGIGKTMLVRRVAVEVRNDGELGQSWYPLIFGEESYEVGSAGEFWLEALFHLGKQTKEERWKQTYAELKKESDEKRLREAALGQLMNFADEQKKRILLVVENLCNILGEQSTPDDGWAIRHTLLNEPRVMLLGTAVRSFEEVEGIDKAMFDLFKVQQLRPLDTEECQQLWQAISGVELSRNRVRPLEILTGGNPRLLTILVSFADKASFRMLMEDLTRLVDDHTDYFKSHLESLAAMERKVFVALADLWDPATARQVGEAARVDVSKTSAFLKRLISKGAVTEAHQEGRKKYYQVAERMYNIYHLMRRRGTPSSRVRAIVRFMIVFYTPEELIETTRSIMAEAFKLDAQQRQDHLMAVEGILNGVAEKEWKEQKDTEKVEYKLKVQIENGIKLLEEEKYEQAEEAFRKIIELEPDYAGAWAVLGELLGKKLDRYEEAEKAYRKSIELSAETLEAWIGLVELLVDKLGRPKEAFSLAEKCLVKNPGKPDLLNHFAYKVYKSGEREYLSKAELWAREAVEAKPDSADYRHTLASVLLMAGKKDEALVHAQRYLEDVEAVKKTMNEAVDLFIGLAAAGYGREGLAMLEGSASAGVLEPLVVALQKYTGVKVVKAQEIEEIANDIIEKIEQRSRDDSEDGFGKSRGKDK